MADLTFEGLSPVDLSYGFRDLKLANVPRAVATSLAQRNTGKASELIRSIKDRFSRGPRTIRWSSRELQEEERDYEAFDRAAEEVEKSIGEQIPNEIKASIRMIWNAPEYSPLLATLLPALEKTHRSRDLARAFEPLSDDVKGRALALLAPYCRYDKQTVAMTKSIRDPLIRARTLSVMTVDMRGDAKDTAASLALSIPDPDAKAVAVTAIACNAKPQVAKRIVNSALYDFASHIAGRGMSARSLEALGSCIYAGDELGSLTQTYERLLEAFVVATPETTRELVLVIPKPYEPKAGQHVSGWNRFTRGLQARVARKAEIQTEPLMEFLKEEAVVPTDLVAPQRAERVMNYGFAPISHPDSSIPKTKSLQLNRPCVYWVELGPPMHTSLNEDPVPITPGVEPPAGTRFDVAVFAAGGGIQLSPKQRERRGTFVLEKNGTAKVERHASDLGVGEGARDRRLYFLLTPVREGTVEMRCNIYCRGNLLQSHRVHALVENSPRDHPEPTQRRVMDYCVSPSLAAEHVVGLEPQKLSIMLNESADGSHRFMFYGPGPDKEPEFQSECDISGTELRDVVLSGREALRRVSWGADGLWDGNTHEYKYDAEDPEFARCNADIIELAKVGSDMWVDLKNRLAGDVLAADLLTEKMKQPGAVEVALKARPERLFPGNLLYDRPIDTGAAALTICAEYRKAPKGALRESRCFRGECPTYGDDTVVCPSGFWGFRHSLGLPVPTGKNRDAARVIKVPRVPNGAVFTVLLSVAEDLTSDGHVEDIKKLSDAEQFRALNDRQKSFDRMKEGKQHLVYFYGHGGIESGRKPYLQVGADTDRITKGNLVNKRVRWTDPRPLVFLNGCRTGAVDPETAYTLVSGFVEDCAAAGVIGTEITIFEPLAREFALECFEHFFNRQSTIGEAVRRSRLKLLEDGNPLGLVYVPYVHGGLKVEVS